MLDWLGQAAMAPGELAQTHGVRIWEGAVSVGLRVPLELSVTALVSQQLPEAARVL